MKRMELSPYGYPIVYYCVQIVLRRTLGAHLPEANALIRTLGTHLPKANALVRTLGAHLPKANALIGTLGTHLPKANALVGIFGTCTFFIKKVIRYGHSPSHSKKRMRRYIRPPNNRATTQSIASHNTLFYIF